MKDTVAQYTRSPTLRSALKNGPIPSFHNFVTRRKKTVSFNDTAEEIHTTVYQLRHSDIASRSPSPSVVLASGQKHALSPSSPGDRSYTLASCRHTDGVHEELEATTPVAGRRKRAREWVWTLAEPGDVITETSNTSAGTSTMSNDRASKAEGTQ